MCWGQNEYGQLGDSTTTDRLVPVQVQGMSSDIIAIAAGEYHSCSLSSAGGTFNCWGYNAFGQLGDGATTERHVPNVRKGRLGRLSFSKLLDDYTHGMLKAVVREMILYYDL